MAVDLFCPRRDCTDNRDGKCNRGWVRMQDWPVAIWPAGQERPVALRCEGFSKREG